MGLMRPALCRAGIFLTLAFAAAAQQLAPIEYVVSIPAPLTHYVQVQARVPTAGRPQVELMMAVWTQYVIREYARNVEGVTARTMSGEPLVIAKSRKNRWRIETRGFDPVMVSYRVYCHVLSVQDNWVDGDFALLNGAPTFLTLAEHASRPHDISLILPAGWKTTVTGMAPAPDGAPHHYRARDYENLVDSPIVAGNPVVREFTVDGKAHYLVDVDEDGVFDGPRAAGDLSKIVAEDARLWRGLPYNKYYFLNLLTGPGGGMEHSNSCALMATHWSTGTTGAYARWLNLASHEFFHAWNVKRLRPAEPIPGEYEIEPYTKSLGISEGFTSYYAPLIVRRAGLSDDDEFLAVLSRQVRELQNTPGRLVQSLSMSSFDTWIKFYRPDENSVNTAISYYTKGAVAGFLLDAHVRAATQGKKSLDDVMRLALAQNPIERGFTPAQFRTAASDTAHENLAGWFAKVFDSTEELDYGEALGWFGLRFDTNESEHRAWLGVRTKVQDGQLAITEIPRDTPAYGTDLDVDDRIVGIDEFHVEPAQWDRLLANYRAGQTVSLLLARRDKLVRVEVTLGREPDDPWNLEIDPASSPEQSEHRRAWLAGSLLSRADSIRASRQASAAARLH